MSGAEIELQAWDQRSGLRLSMVGLEEGGDELKKDTVTGPKSGLGVDGYQQITFWLDKKYNSENLIGQELLSYTSCLIKVLFVIIVHP